MELTQFEGQRKEELAMIEVAHAILEVRGEVMHFNDLLKEVAEYLELDDSQVEAAMTQFYTDLNIDGSFISLGEHRWGLREWYPVDSIDEELTHDNDEEDERPRRRKRKAVVEEEDLEEDFDEEEFEEDEEEFEEEEEEEEEEDIKYGQRVDVDEHGVMTDEEDEEDLGEYEEDLTVLEAEPEEELDEDFSEDDDEEEEEDEEF
ncbi:DNA-directed RNA polymerase subunit delta [Atopococcus tabaci]|uniref:DNA-directed RNA polymerase subunit delta n=1 Tax=Atopococcus tabaci TaxID=269774 RepID=UPI0004034E1B|nr:DNA-directed RNA polymerase subunit delta [Atopococcus tabaci]